MKQVTALTDEQIREYKEQGWIVLPSVFSRKEINVLEKTSYDVLKRPGPEVAREADGTPHVCWGMHLFDERFKILTQHPKLLRPVEQLLESKVFVHQSRINIKQRNGSVVEWHQDFGTYHRVDGIPEARGCLLYTSPSPRDATLSRMPSSA